MRSALRTLLLVGTLAALLGLAASPAAARPAPCPNGGFEAVQFLDQDGELIMSAAAMFPSILRAFADEIYSPEVFASDVAAADKNGNGILCAKDIWEQNGGHGAPPDPEQAQGLGGFFYFIHGIDDKV